MCSASFAREAGQSSEGSLLSAGLLEVPVGAPRGDDAVEFGLN